jgi:c-di-GMP-binding flagellar brake protein YcgR
MAIDQRNLSIHDEVVVETEIDGAFVGLPSFVTNVLAEELWLAVRLPDARLQNLAEGQPIHLAFDRGGTLIVESVFLRRLGHNNRLGADKSRVFAVRRPQGLETAQRRAHVRVDLERTVRIRSLGASGAKAIGTGQTLNIGAGGVQFSTAMALHLGEQLRLALVLTSRDIVVAGGPIVRIEECADTQTEVLGPDDQAPPALCRVAVRFDRISDCDQERIACHILSAHRRQAARMPGVAVGIVAETQAAAEELSPA